MRVLEVDRSDVDAVTDDINACEIFDNVTLTGWLDIGEAKNIW